MISGNISVFAAASVPFAEEATAIIMLGVAVISGIITITQGIINIVKTIKKMKNKEISQEQAMNEIIETLEETKEELEDDNIE